MSPSGQLGEMLQTPLFTIGTTTTTLGRALLVAAVAALTLGLARATLRLVQAHFEHRGEHDRLESRVVSRALAAVVVLVGVEICVHLLGIRLTALFAAGGLFALAAGFAVKNLAENVISGFMLHLEQTVRPGDVIIVSDRWVQVRRLGARITVGTTLDGQEILIPNSTVAQSVVANLTRRDRRGRIECAVGVAYSSDLDLVRRTLEAAVADLGWASEAEEAVVYLREFGDSSVNYLVTAWIDDVTQSPRRTSDLHEAVWSSLKEAAITIAFPQLDVHLQRDEVNP